MAMWNSTGRYEPAGNLDVRYIAEEGEKATSNVASRLFGSLSVRWNIN